MRHKHFVNFFCIPDCVHGADFTTIQRIWFLVFVRDYFSFIYGEDGLWHNTSCVWVGSATSYRVFGPVPGVLWTHLLICKAELLKAQHGLFWGLHESKHGIRLYRAWHRQVRNKWWFSCFSGVLHSLIHSRSRVCTEYFPKHWTE